MSSPVVAVEAAVEALLAADPREAPVSVVGEEICALVRVARRLEAAFLARVETFDRAGGADAAGAGSTAAWLRTTAGVEPAEAGREVRLARNLADVLPLTREMLAAGDISVAGARAISVLDRVLTPAELSGMEHILVAAAEDGGAAEVRAAGVKIRDHLAPERLAAEEGSLFEARRLRTASTFGGVGVGEWSLHAAGQETVLTALHALSAPSAGDGRSRGQRMADALVTMAELALAAKDMPVSGGSPTQVTVAVHVRPEDLQDDCLALGPVTLGHGAVRGSSWAKRVSCDSTIARVMFGPAGEVLDAGRRMRLFSPAQRRAIVARDECCVWPGCRAPAAWCEAHHIRHWADGGPTSVENAALLCGRHHDQVHLHGHAITVRPDGRRTVDLRRGTDPRHRHHRQHALQTPLIA